MKESCWKLANGDCLKKIPIGSVGFLYRILANEKWYYGKKQFFFSKKVKLSKKARKESGTKKRIEKKVSISDWETYTGSSLELNNWIKNNPDKPIHKEILMFCPTKVDLTYREIELLIKENVLFRDDCWNLCIGNKFWKNKITKI